MSGNIDPVLPFISHTGVNLPEAAPFTLVHSISAVCAALIIYIRVWMHFNPFFPNGVFFAGILWVLVIVIIKTSSINKISSSSTISTRLSKALKVTKFRLSILDLNFFSF